MPLDSRSLHNTRSLRENISPARSVSLSTLAAVVFGLLLPPDSEGQINRAEDLSVILSGSGISIPQTSSATVPASDPSVFDAQPGPWGQMQCAYVYLEAPASLIEEFPLPSPISRWTFPESALYSLPAFFSKAGLSESLIATILAPKNLVKEGAFIHLLPPLAELEGITPETRAVIYSELAKYPQNEYQVDPVLIIGTTVEEWYKGSKLRPEIISKIKKLSYTRGEATAFSDIPVLLNYAQSDSEARAIFKACTRTRNLMIRLKLDENSNAEEIIRYWSFGTGLRRKDLEPLVRSVIELDGVNDLGISHILPALARKLLYTYPGLDMAKHGVMPDCHWTSLNFFNYEPHEYLLDARLATSQVLEEFTPVDPPYQFADILFFLDNTTGDAFHSCVHLADNIVFTKNGRNILSPWVIMRLDDVKKIYLYKGNGRVQGFRRKDIAAEKKAALDSP
ncbi:MAG: hypothetical protein K9N47_20820 [Prosthecobacter sp.]|uniref:hypothetical protein n=1 Tax=Prosthecobacter sp. TaxID=1965333 RepID=UPI00262D9152|nr:hypothetical protein [Prosthecobacter sp.]MCF7788578.1 hypothetical protein [Prosthecobacter sp.]